MAFKFLRGIDLASQQITSVADPSSSTDAATKNYVDTVLPPGAVMPYAGTAAPTGWLLCDGSSQLKTTYPSLNTVLGTTFGAGDGTHFVLPDLRGRTVHGVGSVGTNAQPTLALAANGGEQTHALSIAELASHTHAQGDEIGANTGGNLAAGGTGKTDSHSTISTQAAGSGTAHNTMAPYLALNYIIKT